MHLFTTLSMGQTLQIKTWTQKGVHIGSDHKTCSSKQSGSFPPPATTSHISVLWQQKLREAFPITTTYAELSLGYLLRGGINSTQSRLATGYDSKRGRCRCVYNFRVWYGHSEVGELWHCINKALYIWKYVHVVILHPPR